MKNLGTELGSTFGRTPVRGGIGALVGAAALALLLGAGGAPPKPAPAPGLPVVEVAEERSRDHPTAAPYGLPPAAGLVLDATAYRFRPLDRPEALPNVVDLWIDGAGDYRAPWPASRRIELTAKTLTGDRDSAPFPGLRPGARGVLTLGFERPIPGTDRISFEVLWTARFAVAP